MSRVAVVTGANKGLGLAIVKGLCERFDGVVYLTSRDEKRGRNACEELNQLGLRPLFHQLDVTDEASITKFRDFVKEKHVGINIIVNNAGILFLKDANEPKLYQAEQTILVNFTSLVNFTEAMLPLLKDGGKIVNISSSSGHLSRIPSKEIRRRVRSPELSLEALKSSIQEYLEAVRKNKEIEEGWGDSPYVVSKVAVNAYTFLLQRKLEARGIFVNCVHPGYVKSDMTRGSGDVSPARAAEHPLRLALQVSSGGLYVWRDGAPVPWDGPDPRGYKDGKDVPQ
ncbi:carbonyl reductase [NADPH] 3-like [Plodia interpunctella]|uniref:carbonyl reductase [NADPH] 3-like n=1 Tax=Plodia interpunctella TaxID=58824 RepID=UPI002367EE1E|nr:carbonyl reductase [NADPH] 3-like [Plodia interpunctella]